METWRPDAALRSQAKLFLYLFNPNTMPHTTILIVDDNPIVINALEKILKSAGFATLASTSGAEAMNLASKTTPDAAVVDIHLPDISGLVLSQQLRQKLGPDVPIIIVSGDTSMETINSLPHVGATYFFSKPLNVGELISRLKECIKVRKTSDV